MADSKPLTTPVVVVASDRELHSLQRVNGASPVALVPASTSDLQALSEAGAPWLLLIGSGQAGAASRLVERHDALIPLAIAVDDGVFSEPGLLARCASILIGLSESGIVGSRIESLHAPPTDDELESVLALNLIGESPAVRQMLREVGAFADNHAPVLLTGETGTGKELVARAVHYGSERRDGAFVPVNCCTLTDDLLVAELFGYQRGAFTDAKRDHRGLVHEAEGGTLFLDEIDTLSPRGQGSLLRFLQDQEYRPLGASTSVRSDVRVVSATNQDLGDLVEQGRFREDLFYRLDVLQVELPALREREGDVGLLAEHFLAGLNRKYGASKVLHPVTRVWMDEYDWPGNVRELENYLHRVYVLAHNDWILVPTVKGDPVELLMGEAEARRLVDLGDPAGGAYAGARHGDLSPVPELADATFQSAKAAAVARFERDYLCAALRASDGNVSLAARRAGKERRAFTRLLQKYEIDRRQFLPG